MEVAGIEAHGFAELFAGGFVLADLEIGIGQVLADGGSRRSRLDALQE